MSGVEFDRIAIEHGFHPATKEERRLAREAQIRAGLAV
jgi:hypothetical protein